MSSRKGNYIAGIASGTVGTVVAAVIGLWFAPFALHYLDREEYGIFSLANEVLTWLLLFDLGISGALMTYAAQLSGKPDRERLERLASTAFFAQNVVALLVLMAGIFLSLWFSRFFVIRPELHASVRRVIVLLTIGVSVQVFMRTFTSLLIAYQQVHLDNLLGLVAVVLRTALAAALLVAGFGLMSLALGSLAAAVFTAVLACHRTRRLLPRLRIRLASASWRALGEIVSLGIWFSINTIANIAVGSLDSILAGRLIDIGAVTTLTLSSRAYSLSRGFLLKISSTAQPMFGQLSGMQANGRASEVFGQMLAVSTGLAVLGGGVLFAANGAFVAWWVGDNNYGGWRLDMFLALSLVLYCWAMPNRVVLSANGIVRPHVLAKIAEGGLSVIFCIFLGRVYGLPGIVAGHCLADLATSVWYLPWLTSQMFRRSFVRFFSEGTSRLPLFLICMIGIAAAVRMLALHVGGFWGAATGFLLASLCGGGMLWLVGWDATLRTRIIGEAQHYAVLLLRSRA